MDQRTPLKIKAYDDNCPICYELWNESMPWVYPCGHMICEKCFLKQRNVNRKCHICREKFMIKNARKHKKKYRNIMNVVNLNDVNLNEANEVIEDVNASSVESNNSLINYE